MRPGLLNRDPQNLQNPRNHAIRIDRRDWPVHTFRGLRIRQHISDQRLHPQGPLQDACEELPAFQIELTFKFAAQKLRVDRDVAQRLLKIVAG